MLASAVWVNGRRIRRRGVGVVLKLLAYLDAISPKDKGPNQALVWALREFTDIRFPGLFVRFQQGRAMVILDSIMKANVPKSNGSKSGGKKQDFEELAAGIVDTLASEYGWSAQWILEHIDLHTFDILAKQIHMRNRAQATNRQMIDLLIAQNPKQALKRIQENAGMETMTAEQAFKRAREVLKNGGKD